MSQRVFVRFLSILLVSALVGCATATYRGWSEGSQYFEPVKQPPKQQPKNSATPSDTATCSSEYRVRSGDTLSKIALSCNIALAALAKANNLHPPYTLYVNQRLTVPFSGARLPDHQLSSVSQSLPNPGFVWPVKKTLKYAFVEDRSGLNGLRIYANVGEAVYAMDDGEVVYAGNGIAQYGAMLIIKHDNDYLTVYAHNDTLQVVEGAHVTQKQLIATLGKTGEVMEPQLYVEARYRGRKVDIKPMLEPVMHQ